VPGGIIKTYVIREKDEFIAITLDKLAEGHAVPFEVFADDGELMKSLFDRGFLYNVFAKEMIYRQGLVRFYIKSANNLNFNDYLKHAEKLNRLVKDDNVLFSDYSEYKRKHIYIDKTLISPLIPLDFELGGMRYPVYGGIPIVGNPPSVETIDALMKLEADIVIKGEDSPKYENYLHELMYAEKEACTELRSIHIKQELLRCLFSKFLHNLYDQELFGCLLQETLSIVNMVRHFSEHPVFDLKDLFEIRNVDSYVSVHSVNVCIFSIALGVRLGMEEKSLFRLGAGALLHDIGKMLISYEVINKQGDLTIDEFMHYCNHVIEGANCMDKMKDVPKHVREIVLQHHERLDGSGYIQKLAGKDIDILSQIVTVADSYEELMTGTPKRKSLPQERTLQILREDAEEKNKINRTAYRALNSILKE
jgi:putative nucleotidyltransferase with HDIG domain